ncbi:hypothetical protein DPMN_190420 [Dreissena polymorpha]|uniref:Trehalase n=1 Tax=Dreissena polymorpha TaxID=45954 RepID=A0A9D4DUL9_DREPO|nr:hypothetical protein DPMN_190420 [Dreissena polymorpha]
MYYTKRSQPPFFIPMVQLYLHATNDTEFIRSYIDVIEKSTYFGILIEPWILMWRKISNVESLRDTCR